MREEWKGFTTGEWAKEVNVRDFIQKNYTPYDGDASFLAGPTQATTDLWNQVLDLQKQERAAGGVLDMDTHIVTGINAHKPGYIDESMKDLEKIVLSRAVQKHIERKVLVYKNKTVIFN